MGAKLIEVALQMLIAQAAVGSQEEGFQIGDQGVYPAGNSLALRIWDRQNHPANAAQINTPHRLPPFGTAVGTP